MILHVYISQEVEYRCGAHSRIGKNTIIWETPPIAKAARVQNTRMVNTFKQSRVPVRHITLILHQPNASARRNAGPPLTRPEHFLVHIKMPHAHPFVRMTVRHVRENVPLVLPPMARPVLPRHVSSVVLHQQSSDPASQGTDILPPQRVVLVQHVNVHEGEVLGPGGVVSFADDGRGHVSRGV